MSSIFTSLKAALLNTSNKISTGIEQIFSHKKLDSQTLADLEELLISADISVGVATELIEDLKNKKFDKQVTSVEIKEWLAQSITSLLLPTAKSFSLSPDHKPQVILMCGVNGNGKTTTIGKLAAKYIAEGKKVGIAACDTFRAAAVEQLAKWSDRAGALLIFGKREAEPASVAYQAMQEAYNANIDVLFIDTAGRLHNNKNLMAELAKIVNVIKKIDITAPHHSLLVIDATIGQNAYSQVEQFSSVAGVTGLVISKLDGAAKAGVVIGIVRKFSLPVYFIGVGEKIDDIKHFDPVAFARAIVNL